jgi:hypothetical protein
MGLALAVGLGLSLAVDEEVYVLETDGSLLLDLSCLALMGELNARGLLRTRVVVLDNGGYESAGRSRRPNQDLDWRRLIAAFGLTVSVRSMDAIQAGETSDWWKHDISVLQLPMVSPDDTPGSLTGRERVANFRTFLKAVDLTSIPLPATKN